MCPCCLHGCAGLCRHVYANYLTGMAGLFTPSELRRLGDCLPSGSISYIEQDFQVWASHLLLPV